MKIAELYRSVTPLGPSEAPESRAPARGNAPKNTPSDFDKILSDQITLSNHAHTRIQSRAIPWDDRMRARISSGFDVAAGKGSREALILADSVAVITNVKDRTVVTAMDRSQMKEQVFTNIDTAVFV
jgi:flagellar operon protein